jgi:sulfate/thiosulfate transport system ATP-binding protein
MSIEIQGVTKLFGDFKALKGIDLNVETGELVALLGPSGSGKTTLLRIIAGLESPDAGSVAFHGEDALNQKIQERGVGFVFQHYALFRHMSVFENVAFGLRVKGRKERPSADQIKEKVNGLLKLVQLDRMGHRLPTELSGGQRQRVALARALAIEPKMLLLDEPFGALDAKVRKELRGWLRRLHDELHITSVFVTHDVEEALELADRVVVMNEGKIEQIGKPEDVYHDPTNPFVYHFLGSVNLFHCRVEQGMAYFGNTPVALPPHVKQDTKNAKIYIRPHLFEVERVAAGTDFFRAKIKYLNPAGPIVKIELLSEWGDTIQVEIPVGKYFELNLKKDEDVYVRAKEMKVFDQDYSI